jgi:hypothetical protein
MRTSFVDEQVEKMVAGDGNPASRHLLQGDGREEVTCHQTLRKML